MVKKNSKPKRTDITTIQISKETKQKLDEIGKKNETYEDIIKRLLLKWYSFNRIVQKHF